MKEKMTYNEIVKLCELQESIIEALRDNVRQKEEVIDRLPDWDQFRELESLIKKQAD